MTVASILILSGMAFVLSTLLTGAVRRYAVSRNLLDQPGPRGAHDDAVPRGGGLAIVVTTLTAGAVAFAMLPEADWRYFWALLGGGLAVAAIGFADDHGHVKPHWRLLVHIAAAIWALAWMTHLPNPSRYLGLPIAELTLGAALFLIVWMINLYNFMDGIDGLAATETLFLCAVGGLLLYLGGATALACLSWALAAAAAGFLLWNRPPAKIFMGDVGSGFLGYVVAVLMFASHDRGLLQWEAHPVQEALRAPHIWPWLILVAILIVDASVTLIRRILRREAFWRPHSMHAYQHAARRWGHAKVVFGVLVINMVLVLPTALIAWRHIGLRIWLTGGTFAVLAVVVLAFGAGRPQPPKPPAASNGKADAGTPVEAPDSARGHER